MSDNNHTASPAESPGELRNTLIKRLAVAGLLVAVLLGVLAFFDYLAAPEEPEATVYTTPVPVPPKKEMTQPVKPATTLPEPPKPEAEAEAEKPAEPPPPSVPPQPAAAPEARPEPKPAPAPRAAPATPPASAQPAPAAPVAPRTAAPQPVPEATTAPKTAIPPETVGAPPRASEPAVAHPPPAAPRLLSGYVLQAGVFASAQRAEELHAKLTLNGIPSTLEARVQVGPFKTREEADAAREKLKNLGIDAVLIPPRGGKR